MCYPGDGISPRTDGVIGDGIPQMSHVLIAAALDITSSDEHRRHLPPDHFSGRNLTINLLSRITCCTIAVAYIALDQRHHYASIIICHIISYISWSCATWGMEYHQEPLICLVLLRPSSASPGLRMGNVPPGMGTASPEGSLEYPIRGRGQ